MRGAGLQGDWHNEDVQEWAITYAGELLWKGNAPALLDELVSLARNALLDQRVRGAAERALVLAGLGPGDVIRPGSGDRDLESTIAKARRRFQALQDAGG